LLKKHFLIPTRLFHDGKNALGGFKIREGGEDAALRAEWGNIQRFPKDALLLAFPPLILGSEDQTLDAGRMMQEHITNGLGALNDEGAFSVSSPLISEEFSNARRLRARQ
jgi:hypothetical protein